jgi:uncharacterized protein (DUF849 family)
MGSVNFGEDAYINRLAAKHNVELVQKLARLVRLLGHAVATPSEARKVLRIGRI